MEDTGNGANFLVQPFLLGLMSIQSSIYRLSLLHWTITLDQFLKETIQKNNLIFFMKMNDKIRTWNHWIV